MRLTPTPRPNNFRGPWYLVALALVLLVLLALVALFAAGCAVTYDDAHGYRGVIGCINLSGPGFSLSCPEGELRQPTLPDSNKPPGSSQP